MADKLPPLPALTLNRPPTQPRPVDTQRFQSIDMLDKEAAAADPEYQRMLKEIEAMQQRQGWLRGSGAFDKEDSLYLRDKESQQRQAELQQRDLEAAAYAAARARAERERQEAEHASIVLQAKPAGGISSATGGSSSSSSSKAQPGRVPAPLQPVVKVKQRRSKPGSEADAADETAADETASKRPRLLESCAAGQPVAAGEQPQQGQQLQQEEQQLCEQQAEQHHASTDAAAVAGPDKEATGLDALLGAYGSDSDDGSEDTSDEGAAAAAAAGPSSLTPAAGGATGRTVQLPSALELLERDMSGGFAEQHKQQQQQTGRSRVLGPKAAGTTSSSYQQQSGWI